MRPIPTERARTARVAVVDVACRLGPEDRPYPERHEGWAIAVVRRGTFEYRAHDARRIELRPGWLLLGRDGSEFECHHRTCTGDDCMSVHIAGELVEDVRRAHRLDSRALFPSSVLPPVTRISGELARADRTLRGGSSFDADSLALRLVEAVLMACGGEPTLSRAPSRRDRDHVAAALDAIEAAPDEPWALADLAELVGASPFHFARMFRTITGTTPHRYVISARLRQAGMLLLETQRRISEIAFEVGFGDLSNFVHTFRREMGMTPRDFRGRR
ncbi:MAG: helix-turn-helix transcriptional regulator [Kofleriaceae bacterium]